MAKSNTSYQEKEAEKNFDIDSNLKEEDPDDLREEMKDHDENNHEQDLESSCVPDYTQRD